MITLTIIDFKSLDGSRACMRYHKKKKILYKNLQMGPKHISYKVPFTWGFVPNLNYAKVFKEHSV